MLKCTFIKARLHKPIGFNYRFSLAVSVSVQKGVPCDHMRPVLHNQDLRVKTVVCVWVGGASGPLFGRDCVI